MSHRPAIKTQPSIDWNKPHTNGGRYRENLAGGCQVAGRGIDAEDDHVIGVLVGSEQISPGRIEVEVARRFALRGRLPSGCQRAPLRIDREQRDAVVPTAFCRGWAG